MNLVLDFGNTRIKAGIFNGADLVERRVFQSPAEITSSVLNFLPIKKCIIGSVTNDHAEVFEELSACFETRIFTTTMPIPLINKYKSALTLGSDRLAASIGAYNFYPSRNVLTIDAGTCIKYNFVNDNNEYLGGAISPGLDMRLRSMHNDTQALPLVEMDKQYSKLTGQSTSESILSGALIGAVCEADAMIDRYNAMYKDLVIVLTGGDGDYLSAQLKNRFFANQNLLLYGLNTILNYQS
jgi:type III pantothenate kinase